MGHNVKGDFTRLGTDWAVPSPAGAVFDTMHLAKDILGLREAWNPQSKWSLVALCLHLFDADVDKGPRLSDWEATPLSQEQVHYAALDVFYVVHIERTLHELSARWRCKRDMRAFVWMFGDAPRDDDDDDSDDDDVDDDGEDVHPVLEKQRQRVGGQVIWVNAGTEYTGLLLGRSTRATAEDIFVRLESNGTRVEVEEDEMQADPTGPGSYQNLVITGTGWLRIHLYAAYSWGEGLMPQWVPAHEVKAGSFLGLSAASSLPSTHDLVSNEGRERKLSLSTAGIQRGVCVIHAERSLPRIKNLFTAWTKDKQDAMRADVVRLWYLCVSSLATSPQV